MDKEIILLALMKKVEDKLKELSDVSQLRGLRGHEGRPGRDGKDFNIEEHRDLLRSWAKEFAIKFEDFTSEQLALLKGEKGKDGRNGRDGKDGKDFSLEENKKYLEALAQRYALKFEDFTEEQLLKIKGSKGDKGEKGRDGKDFSLEENREYLESLAKKFSIKFEDFTEEEIEKLKGPRGEKGRDGKDFTWEESHEIVKKICKDIVDSCTDKLKLKFTDLTVDEISELRGPKGRDGKDGKDFVFEDHKEYFDSLKLKFSDLTPENIENLKLHFSHLTPEEVNSLKLKFTDLTEEEVSSLRGPRGQRGRQGDKGDKGEAGQSIRGLPGPMGMMGLRGEQGRDGQDGEDAPYITDIKVEQTKNEVEFVFEFSDGSEIRTDAVKLPQGNTYTVVGGSSGGGGGEGGGGGGTWGSITGTLSDQTDLQSALDDKIETSEIGAANGVASLDSGGKIPLSELPDAILGQVEYKGTWNATTNSPALTNPDATAHGHYYITTVAGTQFSISFEIGDWVINNGGSWEKVDNSDAAQTFAGLTDLEDSFPPAGVKITADSFEFQTESTINLNSTSGDSAAALTVLHSDMAGYVENTDSGISASFGINAGNIYFAANDDTNTTDATFEVRNLPGDSIPVPRLLFKGAEFFTAYEYTISVTELQDGYNAHNFQFSPAGNVVVNKEKSGSFFYVYNGTGSTITFDQDTTELFNGNPTYPVPAGKVAVFYQTSELGVYGVQTLGVADVDTRVRPIAMTIDGGGSAVTTGTKRGIWVPYACTISEWKIFGDDAGGSAVVDIKTCDYSSYPTTSSIAASAKPTLSTEDKNEDTTLTGWSPNIAAGTFIEFVVDSNSLHTWLHISMKATMT